ncbi:Protein CBR-DAF-1 [Caenorhabditis briggsae]|nr:Protein CBR-DAF-1 [Caenorhabditis briggsae]ULT96500.1 hypothetical protein L3Y34_004824 [Caenorhabditis briggsae]CAP22968.1 Protein CBR-DAF-1 [Caenorhabditis briggsae]
MHHFLFWLFAFAGVSTFDHDLQGRTNTFIKERLIPVLRERNVRNTNFNRIKICLCSSDAGCTARTKGYIPNIGDGLNASEKALYKNACYTDGNCYQNQQTGSHHDFGCIDSSSKTDETDFHNTASQVCLNITTGDRRSSWVCCDDTNFCSNQTMIVLPDSSPVALGSLKFITIAVVVVFVVIAAIIIVSNRGWFVEYARTQVPMLVKEEKLNKVNDIETNNHYQSSESFSCDAPSTVLTTLPGFPDPFKMLPMAFQDMLSFLGGSSGTGNCEIELAPASFAKKIMIENQVGFGRFGVVYRATYKHESVAIKVFNESNESSFATELHILNNKLNHPQVLRLIGDDRTDHLLGVRTWIVTEFHEKGSLHEFLDRNTIDMERYFNLMYSAAAGLSYLHDTAPGKSTEEYKPEIAHRDIKTRNILVKNDFTCVWADFGLALAKPANGAKLPENIVKNYKCGTVRYLAPEILNSTMQSSEFESYKMADMYSFALVMWETLCRVEHEGITPKDPSSVLPYGEYTPRDPTDAQMIDVVYKRKLRPTVDQLWTKNKDYKGIMDIISIGWSNNPTARYTANSLQTKLFYRKKDFTAKNEALKKKMAMLAAQAPFPPPPPAPQPTVSQPYTNQNEESIPMGTIRTNNRVRDSVEQPIINKFGVVDETQEALIPLV